MKICRFEYEGQVRFGRLRDQKVEVLRGGLFEPGTAVVGTLELSEVKLLAPLLPGKIIGIGRNYGAHARELGNAPPESDPILFLKPPSAVLEPGGTILLPPASQRVDHEGELGVILGRAARNIPESEDPLRYVYGYSCVNDVTARDLQKKDVQFTRAKGFDTFCPFGPWIETELDPSELDVAVRVNGEVRQKGNTKEMIFSVRNLIRYLSNIMTLLPGDLIATGTPAGVGPLRDGDRVEVEVQGIGVLRNSVAAGT